MGADFTPTLGDYSSVKPFRFWCQKVLPLVYDDSLSYYEVLCKVKDYLNNTIEDVAQVEGNVDGLHDAYVSLQNYVNDYFDSLDITTEINTKLEDMLEDGTLSDMLNSLIGSTLNPVIVDSVDDMTDTLTTYVLSSNSHVYQYNGTAFVDTGIVYGGAIGNVLTYNGVLGEGMTLASLPPSDIHFVSFPNGPSDAPEESAGIVVTIGQDGTGAKIQWYIVFGTGLIYHRRYQSKRWFPWVNVIDNATSSSLKYAGIADANFDANTVAPQTMWLVTSAVPATNNVPIPSAGILMTIGIANGSRKQLYYGYSSNLTFHRFYNNTSGTWSNWLSDAIQYYGDSATGEFPIPDNNCDNATANSVYSISSSATNNPTGSVSYLYTIGFTTAAKAQFCVTYGTGEVWYRRYIMASPRRWGSWVKLGTNGGNPVARMLSVGNSILTGSVWLEGSYNHLASYDNSPYGNIAAAIGINSNNVDHTLISSTGLIYDAGEGNFLEKIKETNLSGYDVVLTHLWTGDMSSPLGTINSTAGDGSIAGAVVDLVNYIKVSNGKCQLILVGVPPVSTSIYGDVTFTGNYPNGRNLSACETLMSELAEKYHFTFIGWQDLNLSYYYHSFTDGLNVHANNENTYRAMGGYLGGRASRNINF